MKKLFIIALSILALVAFTTPSVAGGTSGNGFAVNGHIEGLAMIGSIAPGHTAGVAVDGALAAGYTTGSADWWSNAAANQDTQYDYGYGYSGGWGHPASNHHAGGVIQAWGGGSMSQYSNGNTGYGEWYDYGNFRSGAIVAQGSLTAAAGTPNSGVSGMVQATGGVAYAESNGGDYYYYDYASASAGFNSYQTDGYFMYNQTNANNFTMHRGIAEQSVSGHVTDYGYDYYNGGITAKAGIVQGGVTLTHHNSTGNSMYMGAAQVTGAAAATSVGGNGWGYGEASAQGSQTYDYAQGQQNGNGFQWQTGSSHTDVSVYSSY